MHKYRYSFHLTLSVRVPDISGIHPMICVTECRIYPASIQPIACTSLSGGIMTDRAPVPKGLTMYNINPLTTVGAYWCPIEISFVKYKNYCRRL